MVVPFVFNFFGAIYIVYKEINAKDNNDGKRNLCKDCSAKIGNNNGGSSEKDATIIVNNNSNSGVNNDIEEVGEGKKFKEAGADEEFKNFSEWFKDDLNRKLLAALTLLSGADIKILNLLYSRISIPKISFNVLFSDPGKDKVFWIAFVNIFIHNAPLVVIQV